MSGGEMALLYDPKNTKPTVKFGGKKNIIVWGCFSIKITEGKMNGVMY